MTTAFTAMTSKKYFLNTFLSLGSSSKPAWFTGVLGLSEKIYHVADNIPIRPMEYLNKANYTEVIERGHGAPETIVR